MQMINFIKSRPLKSRLFKILCADDMGSRHTSLLLHTEVRWLSRGKILVRLFELRYELFAFFQDYQFRLSHKLNSFTWLSRVVYLADIFSKLNETNVSLQGKDVNIFRAKDKVISLSRKLEHWRSAAEQNEFDSFPFLMDFLHENQLTLEETVRQDILVHLQELAKSLQEYVSFLNDTENLNSWVQNPFQVEKKPNDFSGLNFEELIEIGSDSQLKQKFKEVPLITFWGDLGNEYPELSKRAMLVMLPFVTTYLCESGFSHYVFTKTKYRNRLNAAPD